MPLYQEMNRCACTPFPSTCTCTPLYPLPIHMVRFITLPFSEHTTIPGTLELLGAINTWLREILGANARLGPRPAPLSIEERNEDSARLVDSFSTKYIFLYLQGWWKLLTCHDTIGRSVPRGRRSLSWQTGKLLSWKRNIGLNFQGAHGSCRRKPLKVNMWHSSTCHAHANIRWKSIFDRIKNPENIHFYKHLIFLTGKISG